MTETQTPQNVRHYELTAETKKAALAVNCNIAYCKAEPKASCVSSKGEKVDPHTQRVRKGMAKVVRDAKRAEKEKAAKEAAKKAPAKKATPAKKAADDGKAAYARARDELAAGREVDEETLNAANAYAKTAKKGRLSNEMAG